MNKEVSDLFIDIYQNFNVESQLKKMRKLSRKELLLLLILTTDSYSDEDPFVLNNYKNFAQELQVIHDSLPNLGDDSELPDIDIDMYELGKETGDKFIEVKSLIDIRGKKIPPPLSNEEAVSRRREKGINQIIDNQ